jgi:hypothetical protein
LDAQLSSGVAKAVHAFAAYENPLSHPSHSAPAAALLFHFKQLATAVEA